MLLAGVYVQIQGGVMMSSSPAIASRRTWCVLVIIVALAILSSCAGIHKPTSPRVHAVSAQDAAILDVRTVGKGEPLLLITGYAMTSEMWDQQFVKDLAATRRVILLDNVGMGPSTTRSGTMVSILRMANDALSALDALGIDRCDILGWSMGGMIAQELALMHPDKVRTLVLLSSTSDVSFLKPGLNRISSMNTEAIRSAMFQPDWLKAHPEASSRVVARPRTPDMGIIQGQFKALLDWKGTADRLSELRAPALILVGNDDWLCPPEASRAIHARLSMRPDNPSVLVEFGMGSHWMMHQYPKTLAGIVSAYLSACGSESMK